MESLMQSKITKQYPRLWTSRGQAGQGWKNMAGVNGKMERAKYEIILKEGLLQNTWDGRHGPTQTVTATMECFTSKMNELLKWASQSLEKKKLIQNDLKMWCSN